MAQGRLNAGRAWVWCGLGAGQGEAGQEGGQASGKEGGEAEAGDREEGGGEAGGGEGGRGEEAAGEEAAGEEEVRAAAGRVGRARSIYVKAPPTVLVAPLAGLPEAAVP